MAGKEDSGKAYEYNNKLHSSFYTVASRPFECTEGDLLKVYFFLPALTSYGDQGAAVEADIRIFDIRRPKENLFIKDINLEFGGPGMNIDYEVRGLPAQNAILTIEIILLKPLNNKTILLFALKMLRGSVCVIKNHGDSQMNLPIDAGILQGVTLRRFLCGVACLEAYTGCVLATTNQPLCQHHLEECIKACDSFASE